MVILNNSTAMVVNDIVKYEILFYFCTLLNESKIINI